jgi:hypothetical protein
MVTILVFESAGVSAEMPRPTIVKMPLIMSAQVSLIKTSLVVCNEEKQI